MSGALTTYGGPGPLGRLSRAARSSMLDAVGRHVLRSLSRSARNYYERARNTRGQSSKRMRESSGSQPPYRSRNMSHYPNTGGGSKRLFYNRRKRRRFPVRGKYSLPRLYKNVRKLRAQTVPKSQWYKTADGFQITCAINECSYVSHSTATSTQIDAWGNDEFIGQDGSTISFATGDVGRVLEIIDAKMYFKFRNNTVQDLVLYLWSIKPKRMNNLDPETHLSVAYTDSGEGVTFNIESSIATFPNMLDTWRYFWKTYNYKKVCMKPGDEFEYTVRCPKVFKWRPDWYDSETNSNFWFTRFCLIRINGTVSHDVESPTVVGWNDATLDYTMIATHKARATHGFYRKLDKTQSVFGTFDNPAQAQPSDPTIET